VGRHGFRVDIKRIVGASIHARFTADAIVIIEVHHTVVGAKECVGGAYRHTRCIFAVVAAHDREMAVGLGMAAGFYIFQPSAVNPEGHFVFAFARHGAGMTANATTGVKNKAESCHKKTLNAYWLLSCGFKPGNAGT
jgi:hypothetical protein